MKRKIIIPTAIIFTIILILVGIYKLHPHAYKLTDSTEPTCILGGHNSYQCWCGASYTNDLDPLGHEFEEVLTEPTCIEDGVRTLTCKRCGDIYTEKISKLGHKYINGVCVQCGEKDPSVKEEDTDLVQNLEDKDLIASEGSDKSNDKPNQPTQPTKQPSVQPTPKPTPAPQPSGVYIDDEGFPRGDDGSLAAETGIEYVGVSPEEFNANWEEWAGDSGISFQ